MISSAADFLAGTLKPNATLSGRLRRQFFLE